MSAASHGAITSCLILPGQEFCPREALAEPDIKDTMQVTSYAFTPQIVQRLPCSTEIKGL